VQDKTETGEPGKELMEMRRASQGSNVQEPVPQEKSCEEECKLEMGKEIADNETL